MLEPRRKRSLIRDNHEVTFRLKEIARRMDAQPHPKTVYLWCTRATEKRQVLLESVRTPGGLVTSWEAYQRFLDALEDQ